MNRLDFLTRYTVGSNGRFEEWTLSVNELDLESAKRFFKENYKLDLPTYGDCKFWVVTNIKSGNVLTFIHGYTWSTIQSLDKLLIGVIFGGGYSDKVCGNVLGYSGEKDLKKQVSLYTQREAKIIRREDLRRAKSRRAKALF